MIISYLFPHVIPNSQIIQEQEDLLNKILQPAERWLELDKAHQAAVAEGCDFSWWDVHGDSFMLARARTVDGIRTALGRMVKK